jgi:hypothetical protein
MQQLTDIHVSNSYVNLPYVAHLLQLSCICIVMRIKKFITANFYIRYQTLQLLKDTAENRYKRILQLFLCIFADFSFVEKNLIFHKDMI